MSILKHTGTTLDIGDRHLSQASKLDGVFGKTPLMRFLESGKLFGFSLSRVDIYHASSNMQHTFMECP
jgi:LAS superfamily LD-carboxypeptidase LdcB